VNDLASEAPGFRFHRRLVLATVCCVLVAPPAARGQIRPDPSVLAVAPSGVVDRLRANPFTYFRFVNRAWTERVCELFADVPNPTIVRLHGDAHVEQFALTKDAWGLDDFDNSARGPTFIDIVRFLGSVDLATSQRGWKSSRDAVWDRFFDGYRQGLASPDSVPPEPDIVRRLRGEAPRTPAAYLAWGERRMARMSEAMQKSVVAGMEAFERFVRRERPDLPPGYFAVKRAGWLHMGVGSSTTKKVLIRVEGPTLDPYDDRLLEAKEVVNLDGVRCLERSTTPPALRIVDGVRQLSRLKHDILAVGPTLLIPTPAERTADWLDWWVSSWEPTYREVHLSDLQSVRDLSDIAFDAGVQLGAGKLTSVNEEALSSVTRLEARLRKETSTMVAELLAGWRELSGR